MVEEARADLQRQIDDLVAELAASRIEIAALIRRADASEQRADASEQRADASEQRAELAERRADEAQFRVDRIEADTAIDREMIAELQADGVLSREHAADLEKALLSSRTIGAALGILMARRNIGLDDAVVVLKGTSQRTNTKMRDLALTIVAGADAIK